MMKKIGILTFHRALNYGAIFQTYGLYKTIKKRGGDVSVIDYRAEFNENRFRRKTVSELRNLRVLYSVLFKNSYKLYDRKVFEEFYSRMKYSPLCMKQDELKEICKEYNKIISGSDQVWNLACTEGDDSYFLPFISNKYKKIAYAASIGYSAIPEQYKMNYKTWMSQFLSISVREKSAVKSIEEIIKTKVEYVVDPTFLLSKEEWTKLAIYNRIPEEKYIFMYLMSEDKEIIRFAKKYAMKRNMKIVYITERLFDLKGVLNFRNVTPEQWIGLIDKASVVITNSYHGTVFSINFQKQFFSNLIPRSIANERISSVLHEYNLENRLISNWNGKECDYTKIKSKLLDNKNKSINYIDKYVIGENNEPLF